MKRSHSAIIVWMVMILTLSPALPSAAAANDRGDRPVRLSTTARFSPIGMIAGRAIVDGRAYESGASIWGGELIQTSAGESLRVQLDGVGQVTLAGQAMARISTATRNMLVASLTSGTLTARLNVDAGAYVEAAGTQVAAKAGAQFRVQIAEGRAVLDHIVGEVTTEQQPAAGQRYILRPPAGQGSSLSVSARSTRQLQIQVTDENDRPVPDLPILFSLANPCLGTLGIGAGAGALFKGKTDKRGIASVPWITGAAKCADTILVRVEGTDNTFTYRAQVSGGGGFWTARNTLIVGGLAAGAGIGIGLAVANGSDNKPITPVPPPTVKP
ncbi:MAG TPA: hypothetical protein VKA60_19975 [Blastocatellia bacterium]|nr:hypothetical protein [Blastocatellia bacterium]